MLSQLETYIALGVVTKDDVNPPVISGSFPALQLSASIPSRFYNPPISTNHPPRAMKLSNHPAHPQPSIKPSHSTAIPSKGPQWHNPSPNFQRPSPAHSPRFPSFQACCEAVDRSWPSDSSRSGTRHLGRTRDLDIFFVVRENMNGSQGDPLVN